MRKHSDISLHSAAGSIYFIRDGDELRQGYDLGVVSSRNRDPVPVTVRWPGGKSTCITEPIAEGESTVRVYIPDIREPARLEFSIAGSAPLFIDHIPCRHWTVHIVHFAHHDLGYTDLPSSVLREMAAFLDDALRFCADTDSFPEESRFRYTIEQGWSLIYWMQNRPPEAREEMIRRIREKRIEVNAFVGNEITELLGPEQIARMLYPVFALKRDFEIPVVAAELNDIPGISWGVASVMAAAGLRYFAPGLPDYFRWGRRFHTFWDESIICPDPVRPYAFWWEARSGDRVLFWYGREGAGGSIDPGLSHIPEFLKKLERTDYPYEVVRCIVRGGDRDNSSTRAEFALTAKQWNSLWAYPRLVTSLNAIFFPELERQLSADVPVFRGELPGTDYCVAASCTAHASSLNRTTHDLLMAAERIAAVSSAVSTYEYQRGAIDEAYYCTLMNDEHAWGLAHPTGPGQDACVAQHCEFAYRAAALAHDVLTKAANEIADRIARDSPGFYAAVFNPLSFARTDIVTVPARPMDPCSRPLKPDPAQGNCGQVIYRSFPVDSRDLAVIPDELLRDGFEVVDVATGETIQHEIYEIPEARAPVPYSAYRFAMSRHDPAEGVDVRFVARDLPPMGWRLYRFVPARAAVRPDGDVPGVRVGTNWLENEFYRVEIDTGTGGVASIYDRQLNRELIDPGAVHGANQLVIRSSITASEFTTEGVSIERGRTGPVSGSLVVKSSARGFPQVTQEIVLYSGIKRIDLATRLLKDSESHLETFFAFPLAFVAPRFRYEGPLCVIEPLKDQFPGSNSDYHAVQHWARVEDDEAGVTLVSVDAPVMQFGGNWPLYVSQAHHGVTPPGFDHPFHGPEALEKGHIYSLALLNNYRTNFSPAQCGDLLFRYSITSSAVQEPSAPLASPGSSPEYWSSGSSMNPKNISSRDFGYSVSLPPVAASVCGPGGDLPPVSSFLQVEPANVLLVALKRAEDSDDLVIRLLETDGKETDFTVRLPAVMFTGAVETNLVEEDLRPLSTAGQSVAGRVRAWSTATVRLRLDRGSAASNVDFSQG